MIKSGPVTGPRPDDSYDAIVRAQNEAAKRLVEELRRRYFDVEGRCASEITDLVMRGELPKKSGAERQD